MKTNEYLFSVIVPIYNVEKYLHKTIESVLQPSTYLLIMAGIVINPEL